MHPRTSSSGLIVFAILHHVALALSTFFTIMMFADRWDRDMWLILSLVAAIPVAVFHALILHRGWKSVQDGAAKETPGKAVGFCFIPFFNLYWNFVAHVGLMKEFNRLADSRGRQDQKVSEGFSLTYCILLASICLSSLAALFGVVFIWQTIGAVKDLENS
ncbi:hypothetical protein EMGBS8_10870 [Verrucomicrobiota bacterium]|nr:hypothetical protein EMGBS8_10870 [Verrucomicrobiota bacterium]